MMKSEFEEILAKVSGKSVHQINQKDYEEIELVYNWHPCNFDKISIASLYKDFGITIIEDMLPRAKAFMEYEAEISDIYRTIAELNERKEKILHEKQRIQRLIP